ncbi:MAG TPA: alpha-ketoacid dehydrogenase subunit beta [Chloroflexia bacterium]|nr:alpha-ketoacid dehydrogenase subunit beta [Chloroflexia bacterium]
MPVKTVLEAVRDALFEEMRRDESVFVLGEDVGQRGGVFRVTDGLQKEFGELRVLDTPLAEGAIAGVAIGAAMNGMRPVAEFQFADFIHPAVEQIIDEAARVRYRSNNTFNCPVVFRAPYGGGVQGGMYHSQSVEAMFAMWPGLKVVTPSFPYDYKGLLKSAIRDADPVVFFEHKKTYTLPSVKQEIPEGDYLVPIGKARVVKEGTKLSVFAYGMMLHQSLAAARTLEQEGVSVEVVDLRTLRPLDKETILESVKKTGRALIVHEANLFGGFGGEVAAIIAEEAFEYLDAPVRRLAGLDVPAMPFAIPLEEEFMPNPTKIAEAMRKLAQY